MGRSRFDEEEAADLLRQCHRRCCLCHRFCGVKMEIHHIEQVANGGTSDIENAMPVCFDCHAEINHYNDNHPKGRKFSARELKGHRDQWLKICSERAEVFVAAVGRAQAGPLEALLDELEFNAAVSKKLTPKELGCMLLDEQFRRATESGAVTLLEAEPKTAVLDAYVSISRANYCLRLSQTDDAEERGRALGRAQDALVDAGPRIACAHRALRSYLGLPDAPLDEERPSFRRPRTPSANRLLNHLDACVHVIAEYERVHATTPIGHHHLLRDAVGNVTAWKDGFWDSPPPGIRPVMLAAVARAWNELDAVAGRRDGQQIARALAGEYLQGIATLKGALQKARIEFRNQLDHG